MRGTAEGRGVRTPAGCVVEGLAAALPPVPRRPGVAVFRPSAVAVYRTAPGGSPRNAIAVDVTELEPHGDQVLVRATAVAAPDQTLSADVTAAAVAELDLGPGDRATFVVKASEVAVYPA